MLEGGLRKIPNSYHSVTFQINPCASKEQIQQSGGKVAIEVETEQGTALPRPIEFDVVFPEHLTAEHETLGGMVKGVPAADMGFPRDGDSAHGVSAQLLVSIHPLDVCFDGVYVIEKDKGYAGAAGSLAQTHSADSIWRVGIDNRFDQHDNIGIKSGKTGTCSGMRFKVMTLTEILSINIRIPTHSHGIACSEHTSLWGIKRGYPISPLSFRGFI